MMIYLVTGLGLLLYLLIAFLIGMALKLQGNFWILVGALWFIGVVAAAVCVYVFAKRKKKSDETAQPQAGGDDLELLLREAEAKLTSSRLGRAAGYSTLPVVFLLGQQGSAKTTSLVQSGLDPELLTGQAFQESLVLPTEFLNVWFARGAIFVDAGPKLLGSDSLWSRVVRRMQPGRLKSMLSKREQAPRAAVVCLDCEVFVKSGAAEQLAASARQLRERLSGISTALGISVPVYVLFTKLDKISFFHDYVQNLTPEEVNQVFGATVPFGPAKTAGVYAEEASRKLNEFFDRLFFGLAAKRPEFLSRENNAVRLPGNYEFPREFRKIRTTLVQFLVDLCRPSQLTVGPFLRGFYFCGVRPILIADSAPAAVSSRPAEPSHSSQAGATRMFRMGDMSGQSLPEPVSTQGGSTRKIPQWVFLNHFFPDVVLADRSALGESASSTKTNLLRRTLYASAAALCLLLTFGFTWSFFGNRDLERTVITAARGISSADSAAAVPSHDSLRKLDTLRESVNTLANYERKTPPRPLGLSWGLYSGNGLYPVVRKIYFDRFRQLLFANTQGQLLSTLKALPNKPGAKDNDSYAYFTLKAYLMTTSHHEKTTQEFLAPLLGNRWAVTQPVDPARAERMKLAQKQFDFYAQELRIENPYSSEDDKEAVKHARQYLVQLAATEPIYQAMLTEANKKFKPVNFNKAFPGMVDVVADNRDVNGAFTKEGWAFMRDAIQNPGRYFNGEAWVLGPEATKNMDPAKLRQELTSHYYSDFIRQWREYLRQARVVRYENIGDAAKKLERTAGAQSPLLAMFCLAAQNTAVDEPEVVKAFKPVHNVTSPKACVDQYVGPTNSDYIGKLSDLQMSLGEVAHPLGGGADAAAGVSHQKAQSALFSTRQMAATFGHEDAEATVQKLLEAPITYADALLGRLGPQELNAKGKGLCGDMQRVLGNNFPFNPKSSVPTKLEAVNAIFRPQQGAFWVFYEQNLKKLLPKQGNDYVPDPSSGLTINPRFLRFFKNAAAFSDALYPGGGTEPKLSYSLKPNLSSDIQNVQLTIDGQSIEYSDQNAAAKLFTWPGTGTGVLLKLKASGADQSLPYEGPWGVFAFFWNADKITETSNGGSYEWFLRVSFGKQSHVMVSQSGQPIVLRFDLNTGTSPNVFRRGYFAQLGCVAEIAE